MFITNVVIGNQILDRGFFHSKKEATRHANEQTKEKIWKLPRDS
jgi:dsRNA-specific ribonuclease